MGSISEKVSSILDTILDAISPGPEPIAAPNVVFMTVPQFERLCSEVKTGLILGSCIIVGGMVVYWAGYASAYATGYAAGYIACETDREQSE